MAHRKYAVMMAKLLGEATAHRKYVMIMACRYFACSQSLLTMLTSSKWLFFLSWNLSVATLSFQPGPLTLKNLDFHEGNQLFLRNQRFRSEDGSDNVLGLVGSFVKLLGVSWGLLGASTSTT